VDTSQLTALGYGILIGLCVACVVAFSAWQRRRGIEQELRRLHSHLHDHMAITQEGSKQIKRLSNPGLQFRVGNQRVLPEIKILGVAFKVIVDEPVVHQKINDLIINRTLIVHR